MSRGEEEREAAPTRVALVTGGAVRVGRALSLGLADAGWSVVVNYHSSGSEAEEVAARIREAGRGAALARGDVSDAAEVESVVNVARDTFGRLDLLVNSAAVFPEGDILTLDESEWDGALAVNLKGPWMMAKAAAGLLRESRGSLVNILDNSAFRPWSGHPHHSVAKAGLLHLTRLLARALAPEARANAVSPGPVLLPESYGEEERRAAIERTVLERLGSPQDVVDAVLFLAEADFITGEVIVVDGGSLLGR